MAILKGDNKKNTLSGGVSNDELFGYGGNDVLNGGKGDDTLDGGFRADTMAGGKGNDVYFVDDINDKVSEFARAGNDTVYASVSFTLQPYVENLVLAESYAYDATGNSSDNNMIGNSLNNRLIGKAGNDTLNGGSGIDALYGGLGDDLFVTYGYEGDTIDGGTGFDTLEVTGRNQYLSLSAPYTAISGIEAIKFSGTDHNWLNLTLQSVLALNNDSNDLTVDGNAGDTLSLDAGWNDNGIENGYQLFTQQDASISVNAAITVTHVYTISDIASAYKVGSFFTPNPEAVLIDLGGAQYRNSDLSGGTIDLSGFGLEDTLLISTRVIPDGLRRSGAFVTFPYKKIGNSTVVISSISLTTSHGSTSRSEFLGSIQIVGLPKGGLPYDQFVFV